jgi:hypothetical protein
LYKVRIYNKVPYVGHPGYQKTIVTVENQYYWPGMKNEVANFISKFLEFPKFKDEHKHPSSLLQPFPISEWKWEVVTMNFITKFTRIDKQNDLIIVVVEKLTKATRFIPVKPTHKVANIIEIYM